MIGHPAVIRELTRKASKHFGTQHRLQPMPWTELAYSLLTCVSKVCHRTHVFDKQIFLLWNSPKLRKVSKRRQTRIRLDCQFQQHRSQKQFLLHHKHSTTTSCWRSFDNNLEMQISQVTSIQKIVVKCWNYQELHKNAACLCHFFITQAKVNKLTAKHVHDIEQS